MFFFFFQFTHLPAHSWHRMPYLKTLDISWNPIRVLTRESFYGLSKLQVLRVQHLPDLKRFDGDSLAHITYLTKVIIRFWKKKIKSQMYLSISFLAVYSKLAIYRKIQIQTRICGFWHSQFTNFVCHYWRT